MKQKKHSEHPKKEMKPSTTPSKKSEQELWEEKMKLYKETGILDEGMEVEYPGELKEGQS